jgi:thymidylate synthase
MNNIDKQYQQLLQDILDNGVEKKDRTGTGTISIFGRQIRHDMKDGFPLLTTKRMPFKTIVTELLWFLRGDTNIKFLVDNGCNIWNGDAYKRYHQSFPETEMMSKEDFINKIKTDDEFAKEWGDLGPIYGAQWREWYTTKLIKTTLKDPLTGNDTYITGDEWVDQIASLINDLKTNPDSRRLMVNAWNVGELDRMVLPPCHYGFQVYTRELSWKERWEHYLHKTNSEECLSEIELDKINYPKRAISLMWDQRSVDTFLGLPFNIASYGLLLEIIAKVVNMVPDQLIGNLGDVHLYSNHIEQAKEQIGRELTDEERYNIWFNNNYETGMERYFDVNNQPDYDNDYYQITPKRTREPFELPRLNINTEFWQTESGECGEGLLSVNGFMIGLSNDNFLKCLLEEDIQLCNYISHSSIKAPLSN